MTGTLTRFVDRVRFATFPFCLAHLHQVPYYLWSMRTKMPGCVWLSSDPVPRPASALDRRSGPNSESASWDPSQRVRVPVRLTFRVILAVSESVGPSRGPPQVPSQLVRVSDPSQPVEMVALVGVLLPPRTYQPFGRQVCETTTRG